MSQSNRLRKILSSQRGFSIVEVLIGSSLLTIGAYVLADVLVMNAKVQRGTMSEAEINGVFDRVQKIAGAEWSCTASLAGSRYLEAITVKDPVSPSSVVAAEGAASGPHWRLTQVRMTDVQAVAGQPGVLRGTLQVTARKEMRIQMGAPQVTRTLPDVYFEANADGVITRCYTTSETLAAAQSACRLLGGTWTAESSRCRLGGG